MTGSLDDRLGQRAAATGGDLVAAIDLARALGPVVPQPGSGRTAQRWTMLASLAAGDLSAARIVEAHLDALAIVEESAECSPHSAAKAAWGVYAAEGPGVRVTAEEVDGRWELNGTKPWCSAAAHLDRALVTAHVDGGRRLFDVDLRAPGVIPSHDVWMSRGLKEVVSGPVRFHRTPARPLGETGWYLRRPGFAWGGMGVAACWFGGVVALARGIWAGLQTRQPDQIALMHLGQVDLDVARCRLALLDAADRVDGRLADGPDGVLLAERVRGAVVRAAETVIASSGHALGPAPLTMDEQHARRVADLQVYLRQHHAERDDARLGQLLVEAGTRPW